MAIRHNVRATGIPPYTLLGQRIMRVEALIQQLPATFRIILDEKGVHAGNVTHDQLTRAIETAVQSVLERRDLVRASSLPAPTAAPMRLELTWFNWPDGSMRRLPKDYILTRVGTGTRPDTAATVFQVRHIRHRHAVRHIRHTCSSVRRHLYTRRHTSAGICQTTLMVSAPSRASNREIFPSETKRKGFATGNVCAITCRCCCAKMDKHRWHNDPPQLA